MENYKQLKVIELMGEHVLPYFHKKYEPPLEHQRGSPKST
jgi:hypothetical protein